MKYQFPADDQPLDPSWWAPLELVIRQVAADRRHRYLDAADFMIMGRIVRPPRPSIFLYKHRYTRGYLNLDAEGEAYRYHPPPADSDRSGSYRRHKVLDDALFAVGLWELPWMKPGLEAERRGLKWEDRWRLRMRLERGQLAEDPWEDDLRPCRCHRGWEQPWGEPWTAEEDESWDADEAEASGSTNAVGPGTPAGVRHLRSVGDDR